MEADSPVRRESSRPQRRDPARGLKPLRRKPKTLTEEPELRDVSPGGGAGMVLSGPGDRDRARRNPSQRGGGGPAVTDEQGTVVAVTEAPVVPDPETLRRAREIAGRLAVPRPRSDRTARRGAGDIASVPYRGGSDEIDMDRTLEQLAEHPVPEDEDIVVRERVTTTRSVVLLVDLSGSMRGERVRTAAAAVGALAAELTRDNLAVIAFWSDAAVLSRLGQHVPPERLVETMLRMPAQGLTNVAFPLQVAQRELARVPARTVSARKGRVLLLSDCVHNAGPDPRPFAARLPRLDILLDTTGEQDPDLARDLVRLGRGRLKPIRTYRDVAPALSDLFAS
ncbi:MAG TPA: vWA domain-containing protein [Trebonia sp.]